MHAMTGPQGTRMLWALGICAVVAVSCSSGGGTGDAGPDIDVVVDAGDPGGDPGGDEGALDGFADDGGQGHDLDCPEGQFCLVIEPGAQACSIFADDRRWFNELALLGRIRFVPGVVLLPVDQGTFEADIIQEIEFGPERERPVPAGPGTFSYEYWAGAPGQGSHLFDFNQDYDLGGTSYAVRFRLDFFTHDTVPVRWEFRIDPAFGGDFQPMGILGDGEDYLTEIQFFGSCSYPDLPLWVFQAGMEGGDTVTLQKRYQEPAGGSGPAVIVWAEVTLDGAVHTTDDPFQLVYAAFHHNFDQDYLVILAPPHDDVHAILFEHVWQYQAPTDMIYLDQDMSELRRAAVIQYSEEEQ